MRDVQGSLIRTKVSKVKFPKICPVCIGEPEDLVAITVRTGESIMDSYGWVSRSTLPSEGHKYRGPKEKAVVFWVPTCMKHGSKSVRTLRKKGLAVGAFFVLFYPILYYILGTLSALSSGRPIIGYLSGVLILLASMALMVLYGYFPRALERAIDFVEVDTMKDRLYLRFSNDEYRQEFLELNAMHSDTVASISESEYEEKDETDENA